MVPRAAPSRGHAGATSRAARSRGGGACRAATGRRVGQRMAKRRDVSADGVVGAMRSAGECCRFRNGPGAWPGASNSREKGCRSRRLTLRRRRSTSINSHGKHEIHFVGSLSLRHGVKGLCRLRGSAKQLSAMSKPWGSGCSAVQPFSRVFGGHSADPCRGGARDFRDEIFTGEPAESTDWQDPSRAAPRRLPTARLGPARAPVVRTPAVDRLAVPAAAEAAHCMEMTRPG